MCRSPTESRDFASDGDHNCLQIHSFHLHFTISPSASSSSFKLPETLTLVYLPRINGNLLEINGVKIRDNSPSFLALHRARSMERFSGDKAVYASVDRVRAREAVRFEAYVGSRKAIKGVFRRGEKGSWGLEVRNAMELDLGILEAEVWVGGERGRVLMRERVEMERRRSKRFCLNLEEIVEEVGREGCDCSSCYGDYEDAAEEEEDQEEEKDEEEGVKWGAEIGIWVMCVGVGYLVSKVSYRELRRKRII